MNESLLSKHKIHFEDTEEYIDILKWLRKVRRKNK